MIIVFTDQNYRRKTELLLFEITGSNVRMSILQRRMKENYSFSKEKFSQETRGPVRTRNGEYERRKNAELERFYKRPNIRTFS